MAVLLIIAGAAAALWFGLRMLLRRGRRDAVVRRGRRACRHAGRAADVRGGIYTVTTWPTFGTTTLWPFISVTNFSAEASNSPGNVP